MAFLPLNNLRVNEIPISVIIPWKQLREPSYLHYLEKQEILAAENLGGGVSRCLWSLSLLRPHGAVPSCRSRVPRCFPWRGRLGLGAGSRRLRLPVRTARSIPRAALAAQQECFTIVLLGADKSSQAFYGQVLKVALGVSVIRRQSSGCRTQPYYLWQGTVA